MIWFRKKQAKEKEKDVSEIREQSADCGNERDRESGSGRCSCQPFGCRPCPPRPCRCTGPTGPTGAVVYTLNIR